MGKTRCYACNEDGGLQKAKSLRDAMALRADGGFVWIDLCDPNRHALDALAKPLGLHPLAIEDCLDEDQVPKMEGFSGHTFILLNRCRYLEGTVRAEEVNFFIGKGFLVSVHSHGNPEDSFGDRLEAIASREIEQVQRGPDFMLHVLMDYIVDEKFESVEALQDQLDEAEDRVLRSPGDFQPASLITLRRAILALRKTLAYEREILVRLCRRDSPYISDDAVYHFRDIYDHLARFFEVIEICRELVASIMEIHLAIINNQMTLAANKTNYVMRRLTMITTVFMPLTLLAGIGGMSEWSMMTGPQNWRIAYPVFLGAMVLIAVASNYLLRWLDSRDRADVPAYFVADDAEGPAPVVHQPGATASRTGAAGAKRGRRRRH